MSILSIVVLTFNNQKLLEDCIDSIDRQEIPIPCDKSVVDNGSKNEAIVPNKWRLVRHETNYGIVKGVNRCFEASETEWVLFVSNDVRFFPGAIWTLFNEAHKESVQAMPMIYKPDGAIDNCGMDIMWPGYGMGRTKWKGKYTQVVPNITFLMPKTLWKCAGKFDERIVMGYEDVDFGLRLKGRKIVVEDSKAVHLGNQTLKSTLTRHRHIYKESRRYIVRKHYRGFDRWLRLKAMNVIDAIRGVPLLNNVRI